MSFSEKNSQPTRCLKINHWLRFELGFLDRFLSDCFFLLRWSFDTLANSGSLVVGGAGGGRGPFVFHTASIFLCPIFLSFSLQHTHSDYLSLTYTRILSHTRTHSRARTHAFSPLHTNSLSSHIRSHVRDARAAGIFFA